MSVAIHANTLTRKITTYVQANPGCTRLQILATLPPETKRGSVSNILGRLQRLGVLENRGGYAQYASWHPVETPSTTSPYFGMAEELLEELSSIHHTHRARHLAKRLEEIFDDVDTDEAS